MIVFILLLLIFLAMSIYGWRDLYAPFSDLCSIGGTVGLISTFTFSFVPCILKSVESFNTVATKLGNEIIVQSPGLPTQIVSDLKFVDQPLAIVKTSRVNLYGLLEDSEYSVEIKKTEKN